MGKVEAVGDWDKRGPNLDAIFGADRLSDTAIDAIARATMRFDDAFPGWLLYRKVASGCSLFDRELEEWAVVSARMLASATRSDGKPYVSERSRPRSAWVDQAGRDALDFAIYGRHAEGLNERGKRFGVRAVTYQSVRDPVGFAMWRGIETFRSFVHAEYWAVRRDEMGMELVSVR